MTEKQIESLVRRSFYRPEDDYVVDLVAACLAWPMDDWPDELLETRSYDVVDPPKE